MPIEKLFYEAKPFLYGLLSMYSMTKPDNSLMLYSGLTLAFCSAWVFFLRLNYRSREHARQKL
jgi:hypothetical protein